MPSSTYDPSGVQYYEIPSFSFVSGANIPIKVAYRSYNPSSPKAVCIPTCYGGRINTTLAFTENNGALSSHHVVVVAMLGNGESSSPSNTPNFPQTLDYRDCIRAQYELLTKHLGVSELDAVVGFSMGGQQAYYWASMYPSYVKNAVVICGSARTSGHNYAFLEGPKAALLNSIDYADGAYKANNGTPPLRGLRAFGRAYCAWLTSGAWFRQRQWEKSLGFGSVEEYIANTMEKTFEDWHPEDVLVLARMWQAGDVGVTIDSGSYEEALRGIRARVLVMPGRTDQYFAVEDSEVEVGLLGQGHLAVIESVWGHAAGGGMSEVDAKWMDGRIGEFLK